MNKAELVERVAQKTGMSQRETRTIVDEPAAKAGPIVSSRYRMVGKILQPKMLRWWMARKRIHVLGKR